MMFSDCKVIYASKVLKQANHLLEVEAPKVVRQDSYQALEAFKRVPVMVDITIVKWFINQLTAIELTTRGHHLAVILHSMMVNDGWFNTSKTDVQR